MSELYYSVDRKMGYLKDCEGLHIWYPSYHFYSKDTNTLPPDAIELSIKIYELVDPDLRIGDAYILLDTLLRLTGFYTKVMEPEGIAEFYFENIVTGGTITICDTPDNIRCMGLARLGDIYDKIKEVL